MTWREKAEWLLEHAQRDSDIAWAIDNAALAEMVIEQALEGDEKCVELVRDELISGLQRIAEDDGHG